VQRLEGLPHAVCRDFVQFSCREEGGGGSEGGATCCKTRGTCHSYPTVSSTVGYTTRACAVCRDTPESPRVARAPSYWRDPSPPCPPCRWCPGPWPPPRCGAPCPCCATLLFCPVSPPSAAASLALPSPLPPPRVAACVSSGIPLVRTRFPLPIYNSQPLCCLRGLVGACVA
jgi:hypothetical protein